jgi:hypothetical protein
LVVAASVGGGGAAYSSIAAVIRVTLIKIARIIT